MKIGRWVQGVALVATASFAAACSDAGSDFELDEPVERVALAGELEGRTFTPSSAVSRAGFDFDNECPASWALISVNNFPRTCAQELVVDGTAPALGDMYLEIQVDLAAGDAQTYDGKAERESGVTPAPCSLFVRAWNVTADESGAVNGVAGTGANLARLEIVEAPGLLGGVGKLRLHASFENGEVEGEFEFSRCE